MPDSDEPPRTDGGVDDLLDQLEELGATVDSPAEQREVAEAMQLAAGLSTRGFLGERIQKYTTRDVAESFVGAVLFSLPLLVEDGVFAIAEWFLAVTVAGVPVFFLANVVFVLGMTFGLLYYADFRQIEVTNPILGIIPRRYAGVLFISLFSAFFMLLLWGRLHSEDPTTMEQVSRVTVIWAAAAFGAALGDILPGESEGREFRERIEEFGESFRDD